jgi:hypothetical protein
MEPEAEEEMNDEKMPNGVHHEQLSALNGYVKLIRGFCRSPSLFRANMIVDYKHIVERAGETNQPARIAVAYKNDLIASFIMNGELVYDRCEFTPPLEAVFEGRVCDLVITRTTPIIEECVVPEIAIRIMVRKGKKKQTVVTIHEINDRDDVASLTEVPKDVWF